MFILFLIFAKIRQLSRGVLSVANVSLNSFLMQYVKSVCVCILFLLVMLLSWHFSTVHNISRHDLNNAGIHLLIGVGLAVAGFLLTKVRAGWVALPGQGMLLGSLTGIIPCCMYYVGVFFGSVISGFILGFIAWLFFAVFIAASAMLAVGAVKHAVLSAVRLDFYPIIVCVIVFFSAVTSMMILFTAAQQISDFLAFASLMGIIGGVGGWSVGVPDGTGEVKDANGNIHHVISTLSPDRVITTSGQTMRRRADDSGIYEPLH